MTDIKELIGKNPVKISREEYAIESYNSYSHITKEALIFELSDGTKYKMYHEQDCCEDVYIEDIDGDLNDLLNRKITMFEEESNYTEDECGDTRWTFYKIGNDKTTLTIRWHGTSSRYYSTSVDFEEIKDKKDISEMLSNEIEKINQLIDKIVIDEKAEICSIEEDDCIKLIFRKKETDANGQEKQSVFTFKNEYGALGYLQTLRNSFLETDKQ